MPDAPPQAAAAVTSRFGREVGAGLFLLLFGAGSYFGAWPLAFGQLSGIGPGLMPKTTALIVIAFGIGLLVQGMVAGSEPLESWSLRAMVLVIGAIVAFAAMIRPFGLAVAGPTAVIVASLADPATRAREIIPFAAILTLASILLFKMLLRLPIPLAPLLLGY